MDERLLNWCEVLREVLPAGAGPDPALQSVADPVQVSAAACVGHVGSFHLVGAVHVVLS